MPPTSRAASPSASTFEDRLVILATEAPDPADPEHFYGLTLAEIEDRLRAEAEHQHRLTQLQGDIASYAGTLTAEIRDLHTESTRRASRLHQRVSDLRAAALARADAEAQVRAGVDQLDVVRFE
jgi:hypothetical protein